MHSRSAFALATLLLLLLLLLPGRVDAEPDAARIRASLLVGSMGRRLRYEPAVAERERQYTLNTAPALLGELGFEPTNVVAFVGRAAVANATTYGDQGRALDTWLSAWDIGVDVRASSAPKLLVDLRLGQQSFRVERDPRLDDLLPDVDYRFLRLGIALHADWDPWFARARIGFRLVQDPAERVTNGSDLELVLGVHVDPTWSVMTTGGYTRYWVGSGEGTDDYPSFWLGVSARIEPLTE